MELPEEWKGSFILPTSYL